MSHGFICVGGALDGQWKPQAPGQDRFRVAIFPESAATVFSAENAAMPIGDLAVQHRWYVLEQHDVHGAAWVFKP